MSGPLWRSNPRSVDVVSLADQFDRSISTVNVWPEVAADLFFGPDTGNNVSGAFSISGASGVAFYSETLYGPSPGVTPTQWFRRDDVQRVVLVEMDYYTQVGSGLSAVATRATKYLATAAYFDDENSRVYRDCVRAIPRYRRSLDRNTLRGRFQASMGGMTIDNADGEFDDLLAAACDGSEVRFYIGDITWNRSQFIYVFSATPTKVDAPDLTKIEVTLKDNSALLDIPIGGTQTVGGTSDNANQIRPYLIGYVHNTECVLANYASMQYVHSENHLSDGAQAAIIIPGGSGVRDKGANVGFEDGFNGSVRLHVPPAGTVTADVRRLGTGRTPLATDYQLADTPSAAFRLSNIFHSIYTHTYGWDTGPLVGKIRGALPSYFEGGLNDYYVGFVLTESTNLWAELTDKLCDTGNCFVAFQRDGYLVWGRMRPDALAYLTSSGSRDGVMPITDTISIDDVIGAGPSKPPPVRITHNEPTYYEVQGYANKNWTLQTEFAGTVSASAQAAYRRKGYSAASYVGEDGASATAYLGAVSDPLLKTAQGGAPQNYHRTMTKLQDVETWISCYSDADADTMLSAWEAVRRAQFLPWTEFVDFTVDLSFFQLELGDVVKLQLTDANGNAMRGLGDTLAQVCDIDIDLTGLKIDLGVVYRRPAISTY